MYLKVVHMSETSGIWYKENEPANEGTGFEQCTIIPSSGYSMLIKAKRNGRWWVLKGLKQDYRSLPLYEELLKKEYGILVQMQHPSVVQAIGMEQSENYGSCIVMEYIDGITLTEFLKHSPSLTQRKQIAGMLMDAVEYIHSKQIVHRDLKPENILITHNGKNLKVIDFGLADTDAHTQLKQPAGTLKYMSPEQMQNSIADVRNDIYSLGCILQELHLGFAYKSIIHKCVCEIQSRYHNVASLRLAYDRLRYLPFLIAIPFMLLCLALTAWALHSAFSQQNLQNQKALQNIDKLDQQQTSLDERQNELLLQQAALELRREQDSLTIMRLKDSLNQFSKGTEKEKHQAKLLQQAEKNGKKLLKDEYLQLTSVSSETPPLEIITVIYDKLENYCRDVHGLTESERYQLKHNLYLYCSELLNDYKN